MDKTELMLKLSLLISEKEIKPYINDIYDIRRELEDNNALSSEERFRITSRIKAKIQQEANDALDMAGGRGAIYAATGVGKTKVALDRIKAMIDKALIIPDENLVPAILIVVPTEKLRDEGWKEEFGKWGMEADYEYVERTCYASLDNYKNQEWDLVVLDEGHNITENNAKFFFENNNKISQCIALTATRPVDLVKVDIFRRLKIKEVYKVTLDEAVRLGIVAPYNITVVSLPLDKTDKYIKGGKKEHPYFLTEEMKYDYLTRSVEFGTNPMNRINRMRFIYDLRSKTMAARALLDRVIPQNLRTLIFCGTKSQANQLCEYRYYSKPTKVKEKPLRDNTPVWLAEKLKDSYEAKMEKYETEILEYQGDGSLTLFREGKLNRLACVDALNEGHNIAEDLDCAFLVQLDSKPLNFIQRIGRVLRFRPDHVGKIVILCAEDTVDRDWVNKAVSGLSIANIRWVKLQDVLDGKEEIKFAS